MNHCAHPFRFLSVLLSAYLLLCLCCIILNTSSAEEHRRHHSHHTALHRHHPHHRSRNNHYHHHLIISSRSDQEGVDDNEGPWQEARTHKNRRNRTPRPPSPKPVAPNTHLQQIRHPPPSHSGQPRPPRPYTQGPPSHPPRPEQQCGENAVWIYNCDGAKAAFVRTNRRRGNNCFTTTCSFYLANGGRQQGSQGLQFGCFCRPNYIWEDDPMEAGPAPGTATARCVHPAHCSAAERHQRTTPMKLHLSWAMGLARYRQWVAKRQAAGLWQTDTGNAGDDTQTYFNETAVLGTTSWKVHFLALNEREENRFRFISPQPNWHLLNEEVHERLLAQYGDQWARAFMPEHPASLGRQWTTSGPNTVPDLLYYAWSKHGSAFGSKVPPEAYFALVDRLYREVNLDGRLKDSEITPSDSKFYTVGKFLEAVSTGKDAWKYHLIPEESIRLRLRPMIIEVVICFANVDGKAYIACPGGGTPPTSDTKLQYLATL